jgi:cellobiose phosphorylase
MAFAALGDSHRAWELIGMINPVNHARTAEKAGIYKVEPYVVAADVYAVWPHTGRGGWTWYTGSAGWMYRLVVESLLGLRLEGDVLHVTPCWPPEWDSYMLHYRYRETEYEIKVSRSTSSGGATSFSVDGVAQKEGFLRLVNDGKRHEVEIVARVSADKISLPATGTAGE